MLACLWTALETGKNNKFRWCEFIFESSGQLYHVEMVETTNVSEELLTYSWAKGEVLSSAETSVIFTAVFYPKDYSEQVVWP
jgi:hypothetical protein